MNLLDWLLLIVAVLVAAITVERVWTAWRWRPRTLKAVAGEVGSTRVGGVDGPVSTSGPNSGSLSLAAGVPQTVGANYNRMGLQIYSDAGGIGTVYGLCGTTAQRGTASAANWDFSLAPGGRWDGEISQSVWSGPVQLVSTAAIRVGVLEV